MESCAECDERVSGVSLFVCSYCGRVVCPTHHVPESHRCEAADAAEAPRMIRKHVELGITATRGSSSTGPEPEEPAPSPAEVLRPEAYPAARRTEPVAGSERSPGGKRHRHWTPDSTSPDVHSDGSVAGTTETMVEKADNKSSRWVQVAATEVSVALLILVLYLF